MVGIDPTALPPGLAGLVGISAAFAVMAIALLRIEVGMPYVVCLLVVPSTLGIGFGLAVWLRLGMGLPMYQTWGLLGVLLVGLVAAYEGMQRLRTTPPPTSTRY